MKSKMLSMWKYAAVLLLTWHAVQAETLNNGYVVDSTPNWVVERQYDLDRPPEDALAVQYLLVDQQHRLLSKVSTAASRYFYRFAIRLLNRAGLAANSQLEISFNPAYQTLHLHSLKVIRNGVARELAGSVYVRMVQQEEQLASDIHDGVVTAVLIPEDIRVGDVIDYSYTIEGRNPIFGSNHFGTSRLNFSAPIDKLGLRILTDSSRFRFRSVGVELEPERHRVQGLREYALLRTNVANVIDDGETSPEYSPFAWIDFSEYDSWEAVNKWAAELYSGLGMDSEKVVALARKLRRQSSSDADYITRALFFVQNEIRYLGLELGENSHRPREPREVLNKRYGDCKDKSLLLATLLRQQGIRAWPALVSTNSRYGVERGLPSPGAFDHVITMVEFKGKSYWLDGTRLYQAGGLDDLGFSDYGFALVVGHGNASLQRMYPEPPLASRVDITEEIIASDFNEPVILKVKTEYHRNAAEVQRFQFQNMSLESIKRNFLEYYGRFYSDISAVGVPAYKDDIRRNRFTVSETYRIDNYWKQKDSLIYNKIYNLSYLETLKKPQVRQRTTPYYLGAPRKITSVLHLRYPRNVILKLDENPVSIENPTLRYVYQDQYSDGVYTHTSSLSLKQKDVALGDMRSYLDSLDEIRKDWEYTLTVANPDVVPGYSELLDLKARLKVLSGGYHE
ncbi:MAG: DUF3857 and transglutaminase domain-containing protein [Candidatus Thiodiazotropha sp.]